MTDNTILVEYDDSLIGRTEYLDSANFYSVTPGGVNQALALQVIRYALEKMLEWEPRTSIAKFDRYMIRLMNLEQVVRYIDYPAEIEYGDPRYILACLYPGRIKLDEQTLVQETYRRVLEAGSGDDKKVQFPREYFSGGAGFRRFCLCLKYLVENTLKIRNVEELYNFFDSSAGKKYLYDFRLKVPAEQFSISMPDVIHYVTHDEPHSDLYYFKHKFDTEYKRICNAENEDKADKKDGDPAAESDGREETESNEREY